MKIPIFVMMLLLCFGLSFDTRAAASEAKAKAEREFAISTVDIENVGLFASTEVMTEVYKRLGMKIHVVKLPARRALPDANSGKYDAELYRVAAVAREYPNLRRVPTSIGSIDFVAYGKKGTNIKIENWNSLRPHRLGGLLGIKFIEYNTKGMNINFVSRSEQLPFLIHHNRIDVLLIDRNTMRTILKRMRQAGDGAIADEIQELKQLDSLELYHYVHKKNEKLIPRLDAEILALKKEGWIKKIWETAQP